MALVSHAHNFIFLKTRKTAGTSIEMLLEPLCAGPGHVVAEKTPMRVSSYGIIGSRLTKPPFWKLNRHDRVSSHTPATKLRAWIGAPIFDPMCKITAVRNPFDRMVSQFYWRRRSNPVLNEDFSVIADAFRDYIREGDWNDDTRIVTVDGKFVINEAIRYEHLGEDLRALVVKLNLPLDADLLPKTKVTTSTRRATADYYDAESTDIVRTRMSWAFDNFDYPDTPSAGEQVNPQEVTQ